MTETYRVRVAKPGMVFSAAHFITFAGNICERLHGHNYHVAAEVSGPLDENSYVIDFIALRDALQTVCNELDHHVLLPTQHPTIHVIADEQSVEARFEDRQWKLPRADCVLLPVANTTAELLARHIGHRVLDELHARTGHRLRAIRIEVDECDGQWAIWEVA